MNPMSHVIKNFPKTMMTPRHAAAPSNDTTLRTRYGSIRQITNASGMATTTVTELPRALLETSSQKRECVGVDNHEHRPKLAVVQRTSI